MQVDKSIHPAGRCWLSVDPKDSRPALRLTGAIHSRDGEYSITFGQLTEKEFDAFQSFLLGGCRGGVVGRGGWLCLVVCRCRLGSGL